MSTRRGALAIWGTVLLSIFAVTTASASAPRVVLIEEMDATW
jgi:hypothetical protein